MEKKIQAAAAAAAAPTTDAGVAPPPSRFFRGATSERSYWILLVANYAALFVGSVASSLLSRFYFDHGGSSRWVSTWVQSTGFPLLLIPIFVSFCHRRRRHGAESDNKSGTGSTTIHTGAGEDDRLFSSLITPSMLVVCTVVGLFMGVNNFLFSWGISYLSVSTSSLLLSSQLAFNLVLSVVLVRQRLTFPTVNCVVLLTVSSVLLGLGSGADRPRGVTRAQFFLGFFSILGASALFALYLPVMEIVYRRVSSFRAAMEMQVVMEASATVFSAVGMAAGGGFRDLRREASVFDLGAAAYWATVAATVVCWQLCFMGTAGMVFLTTSLNGGICMTALMSMNVLGGVVVFGDGFGGVKAVSTALCVWAFSSYLYGEHCRRNKKVEEGALQYCTAQRKPAAADGHRADDVVTAADSV